MPRLKRRYNPELVLVFGSRSRGEALADSDLSHQPTAKKSMNSNNCEFAFKDPLAQKSVFNIEYGPGRVV